MATPATRTPIKLARGSYSNLNSSIDDLQEGEIVYATDQDGLYVKEGSSLVSVSVGLLDEDNMATNSATQAASQQSVKAYVDANSGTTNLSNTANGTSLTIESSSGNNTALPAATTSAWGVMTDEDKTKLDGIASSANNYTHPHHSGEVTSTNDGATVIASNVVDEDNLKISNAPSDGKFLQYKDGTDELTWAVPTDTLPLTTEQVQDIVGAMFTGNTETNISATYEDSDGTIDLVADNTQVAIDDTPVDGVTNEAISSNWAYDHNAATGNSAHVPAAGSSGEFLAHNGAWATPTDATKMPLTGGTFTGSVTFEDAINENVFAITDATSPVFEPNNGMLQTWTLNTGSVSGTRTPSDSIAAGQSMLLMVDDGDGSDAITWPSTTWVGGSAPTLATSGYTVIELWKVASTLYAAHVGNVA